MRFTNSELEMIYQYAAPTKAETIGGMKETVPVIKDLLTRVIMENAIEKLQKIPEPECSQFIADNKARFLAGHENSIRRRLAEAKAQTKQPIMQGHDLTGMEQMCIRDSTTDQGNGGQYKDMTLVSGLSAAPELAKALLLYPDEPGGDYGGDYHYVNTVGERLPLCGGGWNSTSSAGVFNVNLGNPRSLSISGIGFRSAFCEL